MKIDGQVFPHSFLTFHFLFLQSVPLDFLILRRAVDVDQLDRLLPIPMIHLNRIQNELALGVIKRLLERSGIPWLRATPNSVLGHGPLPLELRINGPIHSIGTLYKSQL